MKLQQKQRTNFLDYATYISGILLPIFTIPQAYNVLINKQTAGVSLFTWSFYLISSSLFAIYGIKKREKLLIITYLPFTIVEVLIVIGLLLYD